MRKRIYIVVMLAVMITCFGSCNKNKSLPQGAKKNDILTMTPVNQDKTMITVHYEDGVQEDKIEELIEEKFDKVDVVMVHDGSTNSAYPLRQNLINGIECDFILSRSMPSVGDIASEYLLDLSVESFVGNYYLTALDSCVGADERLYYLPGTSDIYGVVYDRTLFEENGWKVPQSYSEFVELINAINNSGIKALQPSLMYADAFQIIFDTFSYDKVYRGVENQQWLLDYQDGKSSMVGHMEPGVDIFKRLYADGIISKEDFDVEPGKRSRMLYREHTTAMIFENQNAYEYNVLYSNSDGHKHEVGIFPFWTSDEENSDYLYSIPAYYMAINKKSADESKEKKELLLDIMSYLSRPETQKKLVENGMQISNVEGVSIVENDFTKDVKKTIDEGRIISTFSYAGADTNRAVEWTMRDTACDMLDGKMSVEEWLRLADDTRDRYIKREDVSEVYGKAEKTFTKLETAQLVGDMYRYETGAAFALVFVGSDSEGVNGYLYKGNITDDSLECISPSNINKFDKCGIAKGTLTGQQIMDYLSGKEGIDSDNPGEHIVASGLKVEYAPWKKKGDWLISCTLPDGTKINPESKYEVAYYAGSLKVIEDEKVEAAYIDDEVILEGTWEEHFISWLKNMGGVLKEKELTTKLIWTDN